jgi:choloylglycine hydrolase
VVDLKDNLYLFELSASPNVIWVDFDKLKLTGGSGPLEINPYDDSLVGDVTDRIEPSSVPF